MRLTRITAKNQRAFMHLLPDESILNGRGRYSIGAINENKPCGVVSFELGDVTADIDWLYVSEDARRQGAGRLLLDGVRDALDKTSLMGVSANYEDGNPELDALFEALGYGEIGSEPHYSLTLKDILLSSVARKAMGVKVTMDITPVSSMTRAQRNQFYAFLNKRMGEEILSLNYAGDYSLCAWKKNELLGCLIASKVDESVVQLDLLVTVGDPGLSAIYMLKQFVEIVSKTMGPDTVIRFVVANDGIIPFVTKVTGIDEKTLYQGRLKEAVLAI